MYIELVLFKLQLLGVDIAEVGSKQFQERREERKWKRKRMRRRRRRRMGKEKERRKRRF